MIDYSKLLNRVKKEELVNIDGKNTTKSILTGKSIWLTSVEKICKYLK